MPGIELPGERRLLFLWLIFTIMLGIIYYVAPVPPFVERFERAYYDVFWTRPLVSTDGETADAPSVGIIAPRHISSLVDTEMWVWMGNETSQAISGTIVITHTTYIWPTPTVVPPNAAEPTALPAGQPTPTPSPTPPGTPVVSQVLMREGEDRSSISTSSRTAVRFADVLPKETVARLLWARIMPVAVDPTQQKDAEGNVIVNVPVPLFANDIGAGQVKFGFILVQGPNGQTDKLELAASDPTRIDTRQALRRGFVRTLLLPPWSNGLLLGLALICAFVLNSTTSIVEQRLEERFREHEAAVGRGSAVADHSQAVYFYNLKSGARIFARSHILTWLPQMLYWVGAIATGMAAVIFLAERLILCPMAREGQSAQDGLLVCPLWPSGTWVFWGGVFTLLCLYFGYLARDHTPGSFRKHLENLWARLNHQPAPRPVEPISPVPPVETGDPTEENPDSDQTAPTSDRNEEEREPSSPLQSAGTTDDAGTRQDAAGAAGAIERNAILPATLTPAPAVTQDTERMLRELAKGTRALTRRLDRINTDSTLNQLLRSRKKFKEEYDDYSAKGAALHPDEWRGSPAHVDLRQIAERLEALDRYIVAAEKYETTHRLVDRGDESAPDHLKDVKTELALVEDTGQEPARQLAAALIERAQGDIESYQERFVNLWHGVDTPEQLVIWLDVLDDIAGRSSADPYVRFFTTADPGNTDHAVMRAGKASTIGRQRLDSYREASVRAAEMTLSSLRRGRYGLLEGGALDQALTLQAEVSDWPDTLPGWRLFPSENNDLIARVERLREEIDALIAQQ